MNIKYRGQWIGSTKSGSYVIVNMDEDKGLISGRVSEFETVTVDGAPFSFWLWSTFKGKATKKNNISGKLFIQSIHHKYGELLTDDVVTELKAKTGIEFSTSITFTGTLKNDSELQIV